MLCKLALPINPKYRIMRITVVYTNMLKRRIILFSAVVGAFVLSALWGRIIDGDELTLSDEDIRAFAGATVAPVEHVSPFRHWVIEENERTLYAFISGDAGVEAEGYGGPLQVLLLMDEWGYIEKVELLPNRETPAYLTEIDWLLEQFTGRSVTDKLTVDEDIDAITRATVTSVAVTDAVRLSSRRAAAAILDMDVPGDEGKKIGFDWVSVLFIAAFLTAGVILRRFRIKWLRFAVLVSAVGVLGFWLGRFIGIGDIGRFFLLAFPDITSGAPVYLLIFGSIIIAAIFGNVFCGWVCPFGAISEIIYAIPGPKLEILGRLTSRLSYARYAALVIVLAIIIGSRELWAGGYEPFDQLFAFVGGTIGFIFTALILVISVFHFHFFCKYVCAVGALLGAFTRAGLKRGASLNCEGCFDCVPVCDMGALQEGEVEPAIDAALCIQCGDCRAICKCQSPPADTRWK